MMLQSIDLQPHSEENGIPKEGEMVRWSRQVNKERKQMKSLLDLILRLYEAVTESQTAGYRVTSISDPKDGAP